MNIAITPARQQRYNSPAALKATPPQSEEPTIVDYVSQGVGVLGGAIQVVLKTPRNSIAPFLLPARQGSKESGVDIPKMAKDPELTGPWGMASSLGGAAFMGAVAGLCIGGPIAIAVGAGIGAKLFRFVDDKLADKARADERAPVFVDGALAKGNAQAEGASSFGVWSSAFSTMSKSSYVEVRDWYASQVKERLQPDAP
ncbi:MAG: hypothetical protein KC800_09515 [Candidatus Eremiobacteraeota bacterium]|nr:hypothetical protein [Candidatus Eremiobacteraeota bacterium]